MKQNKTKTKDNEEEGKKSDFEQVTPVFRSLFFILDTSGAASLD